MPPEPSNTLLEKIFGKKKRTKDINLPNESGQIDPRLKKVDVRGALAEALKGYKQLGEMKLGKKK